MRRKPRARIQSLSASLFAKTTTSACETWQFFLWFFYYHHFCIGFFFCCLLPQLFTPPSRNTPIEEETLHNSFSLLIIKFFYTVYKNQPKLFPLYNAYIIYRAPHIFSDKIDRWHFYNTLDLIGFINYKKKSGDCFCYCCYLFLFFFFLLVKKELIDKVVRVYTFDRVFMAP